MPLSSSFCKCPQWLAGAGLGLQPGARSPIQVTEKTEPGPAAAASSHCPMFVRSCGRQGRWEWDSGAPTPGASASRLNSSPAFRGEQTGAQRG